MCWEGQKTVKYGSGLWMCDCPQVVTTRRMEELLDIVECQQKVGANIIIQTSYLETEWGGECVSC